MLSQFFSQLSSTESLIFITLLLIAFLLGTLLSYVLNGNRIKRQQEAVKRVEAARDRLSEEITQIRADREVLEQSLEENQKLIAEREEAAQEAQDKFEKLKSRFRLMFETLHQANSSIRGYLGTIEDLNHQIKAAPAMKAASRPGSEPGAGGEEHTQEKGEDLPANGNGKSSILQRILKLEHQLHGLEQLNKQIAQGVAQMSSAPAASLSEYQTTVPEGEPETSVMPEGYGVEPADDLTKIKGIGPILQKKLSERGIRTFQQIATFDHKLIEQLTRELDYFPGRIEEDNWVGQAKALLQEKRQKAHHPEPSNDLTLFVGISSEVQDVLKSQGISSWKELSETSVNDLQQIMAETETGLDETLINTWPTQARFADNNQWELLEEYRQRIQDKINP